MSRQSSFEERLERLNAKAGGAQQAATAHLGRSSGSGNGGSGKPPSGSGGSGNENGGFLRWFKSFCIVVVLGVGTLLYVSVQHTVSFTEQASQHAAAAMAGDPAPDPIRPGLFSWLLFGPPADKPIDFLPAETGGWHRVTATDAKIPDILTQFTSRWPEESAPLSQHAGYRHLEHFLKIYRNEDYAERVLSRSRTRAVFLHPQGDFLSVSLKVLPASRALGTADAPNDWLRTLSEIETEDLDRDEILETVALAGFVSINRTEAAGQSLLVRPIGTSLDALNGVKLAVPLSHRIVIRFYGIVEPRRVANLLTSLDVDAMRAALD